MVFVTAATVLNAWQAFDAVSRLQHVFLYGEGTLEDVFKPPTDPATIPNPLDRIGAQTAYDEWKTGVAPYWTLRFRVWERAAKIEFVLLAGTLCLWLLLPRDKPGATPAV